MRDRIFACALACWILAAVSQIPAQAAPASFTRGQWAFGASGGLALVTMGDVNDFLRVRNAVEGTRFGELKSGWEVALDVRRAIHDRAFLGLEVGRLSADVKDRTGTDRYETSGTPVLLVAGLTLEDESDFAIRAFGGLGALAGARLEQAGVDEISNTGFLGCLGGELEYRVVPTIGLELRALARHAKISSPDGAPFDLDFSGGSIRGGVRVYLRARE